MLGTRVLIAGCVATATIIFIYVYRRSAKRACTAREQTEYAANAEVEGNDRRAGDPGDTAPISMVAITINGAPVRLRVDRWTPSGGSAQWGLLLETMGTKLSRDDVQRVLAAFCGGRPLTVLSTRYQEPSFGAARLIKGEIESGARGQPRPCFNPNEDNINYQENDQAARNDRWLLVWQHMARQAAASGGEIVQLVDQSKGLSDMQTAEAEIAADIGVGVARELIAAPPPGAAASAGSPAPPPPNAAASAGASAPLPPPPLPEPQPMSLPPAPATPLAVAPAAADAGGEPTAGELLVVGCANGLDAVGHELDAIGATLPGARILRDVSAEQALEAASYGYTRFHFAGHADPTLGSERTLVWHKEGRLEAVDAATLVRMLRGFQLVVLNGCKSLALAEALGRAGVPNVVGVETLLLDEPGRLFALGFWRHVRAEAARGAPLRDAVRRAFEQGQVAVSTATGVGGTLRTGGSSSVAASTPLYTLGVDPEDASLVEQAGARRGWCLPAAGSDAEGRQAAGRWVLLQPLPPGGLHGAPPDVPEHYEPRAEQQALRDALIGARAPIALVGGGGSGATSLAGTAGLGKTTLAAWLVRDLRVHSTFADGIFWLRFGQERAAAEVLLAMARMLGVAEPDERGRPPSDDEIIAAVTRRLAGRRCLLVLDDVWNHAQVRPFKGLGAGLLLTTRLREVANRAGALREMAPLAPAQALKVLATCMETTADLSTSDDAQQLVRLSGGLPVVLESWGAACRSQSVASLLQELTRARREQVVLEVEGGGDYEYDTFFAGLEAQLGRLEQSDARLAACYCKLAVLREDSEMALDGAAQLWGLGELQTVQTARKLAGMHLLKLTEEDGAARSLSLLDVHLQYLRHRGRNSLAGWHAALLDECPAKVPAVSGYWKDDKNFAHHLVREAGRVTCPRLQYLKCAAA